jgi:hypothetical protein
MKNETHTETELEREARWQRVLAMGDKEIKLAIAADPDTQVPTDPAFLARGRWAEVEKGEVILPLTLDAKTVRWLSEHHVDYQTFLSSVLKAYVASQQNT